MADQFTTLSLALSGVGINTIYAVQQGSDVFSVLVAGGIFTVVCVALGSIGTVLAGLYLLATFLTRGETFITWVTSLINAK